MEYSTGLHVTLVLTLDLCDTNSVWFQRNHLACNRKEFQWSPRRSFYRRPNSESYLPPLPQNARIGLATGGKLCTKGPAWEKIQKANLAGSRSKISPPLGIVRFGVFGQRTFLWTHIHSRRLVIRGGCNCIRLDLAITCFFCVRECGRPPKNQCISHKLRWHEQFLRKLLPNLIFHRSGPALLRSSTWQPDQITTHDQIGMNCKTATGYPDHCSRKLLPCLLWVRRQKQHLLVSKSYFWAFYCPGYLALWILLVCIIVNDTVKILPRNAKRFWVIGLGQGSRKILLLCRPNFGAQHRTQFSLQNSKIKDLTY